MSSFFSQIQSNNHEFKNQVSVKIVVSNNFQFSQFKAVNDIQHMSSIITYNKSMEATSKKYGGHVSQHTNNLGSAKSMENLKVDTGKSMLAARPIKNFQKYEVIIQNQYLENQLKLIQWRSKTQFPIVKILFYKILQKKLLNQCSVLQIAIQHFPCNLNSLPKMPLYQVLYLIKQSLVGFERLFDRFGSFYISNKMILIGKSSTCKVWMNENITLNYPSRQTRVNQKEFFGTIVPLFEEKCLKSTLSTEFFINIKNNRKIVEAIQYIEAFIKVHRIVLPNKLNSITQSLGSKALLQKHEQKIQKINENFFGHESIKKVPKFIAQLREQRKLQKQTGNKSFDSPNKNKYDRTSRDLSQVKNVIKKEVTLGKSELDKVSDISPKSQISTDHKKQTKSNLDKKEGKYINRPLLRQRSQKLINFNFNTSPPQTPTTDIKTDHAIQLKQIKQFYNDELFYTKLPDKPQQKARKFSNNINQMVSLKFQNEKHRQRINDKCQNSILSSQQTATTIDQSRKKKHKPEKIQLIEQYGHKVESREGVQETDIFEKNGWLKRMNSLNAQNIRETLESQHDGTETFSSDFALVGETLGLLGSMGKELKQSCIHLE